MEGLYMDSIRTTIGNYQIGGGTEAGGWLLYRCYKGSKVGENTLYTYCKNPGISIAKTVIDSSGVMREKTITEVKTMVLNENNQPIELQCTPPRAG
jgi:hypothetical protein